MKNNEYIENMLNNLNHTYYAHTKASRPKELLASHLNLTYEYYKKMKEEKNLDKIVKNIIESAFHSDINLTEIIYDLFEQAIYYHDIGKINPLFQKNKMDNDLNIKVNNSDDSHAALSARIYIDSVIEKVEQQEIKKEDRIKTLYTGYYFGYIISRHHTKLESLNDLLDCIKSKEIPEITPPQIHIYENQLGRDKFEKLVERLELDPISMYILCKTLYSCIITSDFYATYDYMTDKRIEFIVNRKEYLFEKYEQSDLYNKIRKYENKELKLEGINQIRSDLFLETEKNLLKNMSKNIFYLEAPTGAGKTNMAINLARVLYKNDINIKTIHYIFPFNNIIEQTDTTFKNYFEKYKDYVVINSISSMTDTNSEEMDYEAIYTKNIFNQYPIVITSHINLFNTLFGTSKEKNYNLYNYINSVVILDEIQAYSNNIWREMIEMFDKYSKLLNIKFIIMSATLPRLDNLLNQKSSSFCPLIEDVTKYYENDLFSKRVKLNYELLNEVIDINKLADIILEHHKKKILVECIKKDTAENLYSKLKEKNENTYIMTGDDNKYFRQKIIEKTKEDKEMILIATQVIEAGVDIDMDIGFKDITFLDGEEQFIGRVNRSNKKKDCVVYFFNLDDARTVYRNDRRVEFNLNKEENRLLLENKRFDLFYHKVLKIVYENSEKYTDSNIENFRKNCVLINYRKIERTMQLIKTNSVDIFVNYKINLNRKEIQGSDIFEKYKEIYSDDTISYSEKKVKLSQIAEKFNLFTYSINTNNLSLIEGEKICGIYYINDGEKYIDEGRFNRNKYMERGEELFL